MELILFEYPVKGWNIEKTKAKLMADFSADVVEYLMGQYRYFYVVAVNPFTKQPINNPMTSWAQLKKALIECDAEEHIFFFSDKLSLSDIVEEKIPWWRFSKNRRTHGYAININRFDAMGFYSTSHTSIEIIGDFDEMSKLFTHLINLQRGSRSVEKFNVDR